MIQRHLVVRCVIGSIPHSEKIEICLLVYKKINNNNNKIILIIEKREKTTLYVKYTLLLLE